MRSAAADDKRTQTQSGINAQQSTRNDLFHAQQSTRSHDVVHNRSQARTCSGFALRSDNIAAITTEITADFRQNVTAKSRRSILAYSALLKSAIFLMRCKCKAIKLL